MSKKPRQRRYVWAVNYATPDDWECLRDDGGFDAVIDMANVNCLPQLYPSCRAALDAGEEQYRNDCIDHHDGELVKGPDHDDSRELYVRLPGADQAEETPAVVICARRLTLPVTR